MKPIGVFEYTDLLGRELTRMTGANPADEGRVAFMRTARAWKLAGASVDEASEWIVYCKLTPEQAKPLIDQDVTPMQWLAGQPD